MKIMKIMNIKRAVLGVLVALCLVGSLGTPVLAVPEMDHQFYGDVTSGGEPLPPEVLAEGVSVEAKIDGELRASTTVDLDSTYGWGETEFEVLAEEASAGDPIKFYVNGVEAELYDVGAGEPLDSYPFENGGYTELDLNVTVLDTTPPTVGITIADPVNLANVGAVAVTITSDEAGTYAYTIDDTDAAIAAITGTDAMLAGETITLSLDLSTLADGAITADASVEDAAGNTGVAQDTTRKDTVAPVVAITFPLEGALLDSLDVTIVGTATEVDEVTVDGSGGMPVFDGAFSIHIRFHDEGACSITVTATDAAGNVGSDTVNFTIDVTAPVSFTTTLLEGWNLLSTPILLAADSDTLGQIFGTDVGNTEAAYSWDQNEQWVLLTNDYELLPLYGIYVKVSSGASATAEFIPSGERSELPSRELQRGLNLIGPAPALVEGVFPDTPLGLALISIEEAEDGLRGYTIVVSPEHNQTAWSYALGGEIKDLVPFKGYWVVMENGPDTLVGFSTTP